MYETDFPEYGQQCELVTPWRGYHRGTIVGRTARGFIVQFCSGAEIICGRHMLMTFPAMRR